MPGDFTMTAFVDFVSQMVEWGLLDIANPDVKAG
jgi:hypothetical protein